MALKCGRHQSGHRSRVGELHLRAPPTQARRQDKRAPSGPYHSTNKQKTLWGVGNKGQTIKEGNGWRYGYIHGDTWHNFCILYFIIYLCARLFNYGNSWMWANKDVSYHPTLVTSSPRGFWIKKLKEDFFYSWWRESVQKFRHWARVRTKQFWVKLTRPSILSELDAFRPILSCSDKQQFWDFK